MTTPRLLWGCCRAHKAHTLPLVASNLAHVQGVSASTLRYASSAAVTLDQASTSMPSPDHPSTPYASSHAIRPLLQSARKLLDEEIGGDRFWSNRLSESLLDLEPRTKRISVYGDRLAAPEDVISALLQTPFSDTSEISSFIVDRQRHESAEVLQFSFGSQLKRNTNSLFLPSGWLEQSGADLFEINANPLPHLLRSDVIVLVVDPYRLLDTESIFNIPRQVIDHSHIVINGHLPPHQTQTTILTRLQQRLGPSFSGTVHFSNARAALDAYDILRIGGTSPDSVSAYQTLFLSSDIGALQRELLNAQTISPPELSLGLALRHARSITQGNTDQVQTILRTIKDLRTAASAAATRARHLSVASKRIEGGMIQGSIGASKVESALRISSLFTQRLSWLSLLLRLRVDDIADDLEREIARAFVDVEQELIYEAGQLCQIQSHLSKQADQIVRHPSPPFGSAVLVNRLSTLSLSIPAVEAKTLIAPIQQRRLQLVTETVPQTHSSARRTLYQGYLGAAAGMTASWAAYVPPMEIISSTTALGLGMLSVVSSVYWGQLRWQKTQKAFWRSWDRCTELLQADVKALFDSTVDLMVIAKPDAAAEGLEELIERRLSTLGTLEKRIEQLEKR